MPRNLLIFFWTAVGLVYLAGAIFIDVMDVDSSQYASIACEMLDSNNWLIIKHKNADYLDKPPLLFWLSAFSYKLFGINHFAYRLPSILAGILGLFAVYGIAEKLYDRKTAELAALITASSQAWILFNHDIRTDTMLAAFSIIALWQLLLYSENKKAFNFILGFIAIGLALMAKGPLGAVIPASALSAYWLAKKQWRNFIRLEWILGILIVLLVLSPMLIGLWQQWQWEGIYFFFWKQSFGRITGENSWRNESGPLFFTHTFLWSFLPWAILAVWAYFKRFYRFWQKGPDMEMLTFLGFLIPFIVLSFSKYKLPHYIFPLYPLMAIITANELNKLISHSSSTVYKIFFGIHSFLNAIILMAIFVICLFVFPTESLFIWGIIILGLACNIYLLYQVKFAAYRIFSGCLSAFLLLNLLMNLHFYPNLMQYQSGSVAAKFIIKNNIDIDELAVYRLYPNSLDFYTKSIPQIFESPGALIRAVSAQPLWIYTDETGKKQLEDSGAILENDVSFDHFHISKLSIKFINPKTRASVTGKAYLLRVVGVVG